MHRLPPPPLLIYIWPLPTFRSPFFSDRQMEDSQMLKEKVAILQQSRMLMSTSVLMYSRTRVHICVAVLLKYELVLMVLVVQVLSTCTRIPLQCTKDFEYILSE